MEFLFFVFQSVNLNCQKVQNRYFPQSKMNIIKKLQNTTLPLKQPDSSLVLYQEKIAQQSQQALIKALKEELIRLQQENQNILKENKQLKKQIEKYQLESQTLQQKVKGLKENNESLIHTFQVFQNQFVKRNKRESFSNLGSLGVQNQGPFHLQIIRTVKSKIINSYIEPVVGEQKSQFMELYNYFFQQNSVQEEEVELFNQLVQSEKKIRPSKVKSLGKRNYFNERFRHMFWMNAIENKLKLTEKYYSILQSQLQQNVENRPPKTSIIDLDIRRMDFRIDDSKTFNLKAQLKKLLSLFQLYRPDIGYVQGMSYFAWMFLIRMNPLNSFICFTNVILTDPFVSSLYTFQEPKIKRIVEFFQQCMADKKPKLYKYAQQLAVDSQLFIIEWAYTFYSRAFSLKIVSKIWDLWFSEGFNVFFKVAMTVLEMLQPELMQVIQSDKYVELLRNSTYKLQENEFLRILNKQKLFQDLKLQLV